MASLRPRGIVEYLQILWRRKLIIILFAAAMMIATYTAMAPIPDIYEAKSLVAITIHSGEERETVDIQVASINQYLLSRSNLEPLIVKYNLYGDKIDIESAIARLRLNANVEMKLREYYPQYPVSFIVSFKHSDPELAMQVANDLASYFSNTNEMLEKRAAEEIRVLNATIAELEGRLKQINQQRLAKSSGNKDLIRMQRAALVASIDNLTDKEFSLNQRLAQQKRQIAEQEKLVASSPVSVVGDNGRGTSAYGVLLSQKAQLLAQLKDQTSQYTEKNSKVIQTRNQIAELDRQLAQYEAGRGEQAGAAGFSPEMRELRALQRELANIETEVELNQRELSRKRQALSLLPSVEITPGSIASADTGILAPSDENLANLDAGDEYSLMFNRLSKLSERRDSLIRLGAAKAGGGSALFQVVDKAVLPQFPIAPNRIKLMALAFVLSIGLGLLAAVIVELPKLPMINDERDIQYYLGAPVVGLIPETLTPSENNRKRKFVVVRALLILLFVVSLVPVLTLLFTKTQIFQMFAK
jgi:uncharacterized protein involved in exopolysaccharide biosynthesis